MTCIKLNLNYRAFLAIFNEIKKIEIRANKNDIDNVDSINNLRIGDFIVFMNDTYPFEIKCIVKRIVLYNTVRKLLMLEGTKFTLSSTNDLEEGIKSIESINGYKDLIAAHGVFAIEIHPIL